MLDWVPEPVCQTTSGKCASSLPSDTSAAAFTMASPIVVSSRPRLMFTSAAAHFTMPSARTIGAGCFSQPILKLPMERWLWAPQYLSVRTWSGPKVSVSVRRRETFSAMIVLLPGHRFSGFGLAATSRRYNGPRHAAPKLRRRSVQSRCRAYRLGRAHLRAADAHRADQAGVQSAADAARQGRHRPHPRIQAGRHHHRLEPRRGGRDRRDRGAGRCLSRAPARVVRSGRQPHEPALRHRGAQSAGAGRRQRSERQRADLAHHRARRAARPAATGRSRRCSTSTPPSARPSWPPAGSAATWPRSKRRC